MGLGPAVGVAPAEAERRRRRHLAGAALGWFVVAGTAVGAFALSRSDPSTVVDSAERPAVLLSTTLPPATVRDGASVAVEGEPVRGAQTTIVVTGLPPRTELTAYLADSAQKFSVSTGVTDDAGSARLEFTVPNVGPHEGQCADPTLACEYRPIDLGPHELSVSLGNGIDPVDATQIDIGGSRRNVAYPSGVFGECGPVRTEFDGATWVADEPGQLLEPGRAELVHLDGTFTVTGQSRAVFVAEDGRTAPFSRSDVDYFC